MSSSTDLDKPKPRPRKAKLICNIFDTEYEVIHNVIVETLGWRITENENDDWDITWSDNAVPTEKLSKMKLYQKINHFPGMHGICKKNYLAWNLNKLLKIFPSDYNFYPKTWVLPADFLDFKSQLNKKKIFIVKPEASSQGRGIFLIRRLEEINISERYVVQEYLSNPLLIENLKFDLRIYVLVTGCSPLRVYIHEDGLTRLATEAYTVPNAKNFSNYFMHLTNYAINKNNPSFKYNSNPEDDDIGHKRSLKSTYKYLLSIGKNVDLLKEKIDEIILKTIFAVQPSLTHAYKSCQPEDFTNSMCFELLGFDIIIDNDLNPILLEVNHSPSFSTDSPLDLKIKQRLIRETLQILGSRVRTRKEFYVEKKNEMQRRAFSCKNSKISREERLEKGKAAAEWRDNWENNHLGGFRRLFPSANPEKYEGFINAAIKIWSDISARVTKKKPEEPPVVKSPLKRRPMPIEKKSTTMSASSLETREKEQLDANRSGEFDLQAIKKSCLAYQLNESSFQMKDLYVYKQIENLIKEKREANSALRGSEYLSKVSNSIKPEKKTCKESNLGNFLVPRTFDFAPKVVIPSGRTREQTIPRNVKEINNVTF